MYPISSAAKALFEAEQLQVLRITGTDENNTAISITDENVMNGGFYIDRYCCNGSRLEIGTAVAAEMTLRLDNRQGQFSGIRFEGAELKAEVGVADWSQASPTITWVPCGYFTPDEQPRNQSTISIHALDRMMRFDRNVETITLPATIAELVGQACTACNVPFTQNISGFPNSGFTVTELPELQTKITYRQIIQWCAGIMASNAWIDWEGKLRFSWYGTNPNYVSTTENRFSSDLYEDDITITGVLYTNTQNVTITAGTNDYAFDLTGNYLVRGSSILTNIYGVVRNITYRPFSATVISAPYLWPMDAITFTDNGGADHTCVVTNVAFGLNSVTSLKGVGETAQTNAGVGPNSMTSAQAFLVEKAVQSTLDTVDASLTQQDIFNRLTENGQLQGLYMLNGELYVNASYIQSGTMSADRIYGGILTLGGANNVNGQMQVKDANGNVVGTWDNTSIKVKSANGDYQASVTNGQFALFGYLIPDGSNVPQWLPLVEFRGSSTDGTLGNAKGTITGNAPLVLGDSAKPVSLEYVDKTIYPNVLVRLGIEGGGMGTGQYIVSHPELFRKALGIGNSTGAFPIPVEQGGTGQTSLQAARNAMGLGNTTGALPAANGGTGQTSLQAARNAMGLGNTTGALPVANGGTGATAEAAARANLGFGTEAMNFRVANTTGANQAFLIYATVQNGNYPGRYGHTLIFYPSETGIGLFDSTDGQSIWTITDKGDPVTIAHGGTGADSAAAARANLGAAALSDIVLATGQYAPGNIPAGGRGSTTITFPSVGTTNYMVLCNPLLGDISCGVQSKTATSFTLFYRNNDSSARNGTVNWAVIKLP